MAKLAVPDALLYVDMLLYVGRAVVRRSCVVVPFRVGTGLDLTSALALFSFRKRLIGCSHRIQRGLFKRVFRDIGDDRTLLLMPPNAGTSHTPSSTRSYIIPDSTTLETDDKIIIAYFSVLVQSSTRRARGKSEWQRSVYPDDTACVLPPPVETC